VGVRRVYPMTMHSQEASSKAVFLNGLLHGFSWDGTPTLAPALAFPNWGSVLLFLVSYGERVNHTTQDDLKPSRFGRA
jgi:hypothetical protein